jgi:hypothetical protein
MIFLDKIKKYINIFSDDDVISFDIYIQKNDENLFIKSLSDVNFEIKKEKIYKKNNAHFVNLILTEKDIEEIINDNENINNTLRNKFEAQFKKRKNEQ